MLSPAQVQVVQPAPAPAGTRPARTGRTQFVSNQSTSFNASFNGRSCSYPLRPDAGNTHHTVSGDAMMQALDYLNSRCIDVGPPSEIKKEGWTSLSQYVDGVIIPIGKYITWMCPSGQLWAFTATTKERKPIAFLAKYWNATRFQYPRIVMELPKGGGKKATAPKKRKRASEDSDEE